MKPTKMVVRFADGRIKKGYSQDFSQNKPTFHLTKDRAGGPGAWEEIQVADLKAVFFVNSFPGNTHNKEKKDFSEEDNLIGRKIEVVFADGEILRGSILGYNARETGFFFFPADPKSNNQRAFVVNASVKKIRYLGSDPTPASAKNDYQCLIPENHGKVLMVSGEERRVLRLVLSKVLEIDSGREYIVENLGEYYLKIAQELLEEMERA